ncbi:MAG: 2-polyprenylphenol 6-hydroxylase [Nitrospirota bacterium]|nr:2-polyprenylphenol 6-hydroxylase [Nitrospirota bacterium]
MSIFPAKVKFRFRDVARTRQIVNIAIKHGFGQFIDQMSLGGLMSAGMRLVTFQKQEAYEKKTPAERLRLAMEELGPTFIKLGQILSARPDLIPLEFAEEFKKLLDEVPPFPVDEAKAVIERELGCSISEAFASFDETPIAAASIAQVHGATLANGADGEEVIVKVQRPNIEKTIELDIHLLYTLASLAETYVPEVGVYNPTAIVNEFARTIRKELNFTMEADNASRLRGNFENDPFLYVPKVYHDLSRRRVLVMERVRGMRIDEFEKIEASGLDRGELARKGAEAFFKQIFEDGYFHADPHPGNMFVLQDGTIALVDFGIMGRLTDELKDVISKTFIAIVQRDFDMMVHQYIKLGFLGVEVDLEKFRREFKADLVDVLEPVYGKTLKQINISDYIDHVIRLAIKHKLKIQPDLLLINKALLTVEGIGRQLDPEFNFMEVAEPYALTLITRQQSPGKVARKFRRDLIVITDLLEMLPKQLGALVRKALTNDAQVRMEHIGMDRLIRDMDRSSNRISFSLVISAIIIGSSIIIHSGQGKLLFGFPALGVTGFVIAGILGLWLVIAILRSGQM